jgi:ketosteroid isomerase-like protein
MSTAELAGFLETTLDAQIRAEVALHNGDAVPRLSTWSHHDPITLFGAGVPLRTGWADVHPVFDWLATTFTACDDYEFELIAADADGDLAYTVGIERYRATNAAATRVQNTLRVTHIYRREPDGWKIVHRHGDHLPDDVSARVGSWRCQVPGAATPSDSYALIRLIVQSSVSSGRRRLRSRFRSLPRSSTGPSRRLSNSSAPVVASPNQ